MTEATTKRYQLRMTSDYEFFEYDGTHLYRRWAAGQIVTDDADIKLLEGHVAPVERIPFSPEQEH
jgi:hypothetical protein